MIIAVVQMPMPKRSKAAAIAAQRGETIVRDEKSRFVLAAARLVEKYQFRDEWPPTGPAAASVPAAFAVDAHNLRHRWRDGCAGQHRCNGLRGNGQSFTRARRVNEADSCPAARCR